jgi:hypothetical protein
MVRMADPTEIAAEFFRNRNPVGSLVLVIDLEPLERPAELAGGARFAETSGKWGKPAEYNH